MTDVRLVRTQSGDQGTFGLLLFDDRFLYTGELPWRGNKPNYSCIPAGNYEVRVRHSPKYGEVYHVTNVEGRSYILFHQGNYCGDRLLGFKTNVQGCILLGRKRGRLNGQRVVLSSRPARRSFETVMEFKPFKLEVINGWYT